MEVAETWQSSSIPVGGVEFETGVQKNETIAGGLPTLYEAPQFVADVDKLGTLAGGKLSDADHE